MGWGGSNWKEQQGSKIQSQLLEKVSSQGKVSSTDWLLITWTGSSPMTVCRLFLSYKKDHIPITQPVYWKVSGSKMALDILSHSYRPSGKWCLLYCQLEPKCQPKCLNLRFCPVIKRPHSWNPKILIIIIVPYITYVLSNTAEWQVSVCRGSPAPSALKRKKKSKKRRVCVYLNSVYSPLCCL